MTLDEAINHARQKAYELHMNGCDDCAHEHKQLAMWLSDYQNMLESTYTPMRLNKIDKSLYHRSELAVQYLQNSLNNYERYLRSRTSPRMHETRDEVAKILNVILEMRHEWLRLCEVSMNAGVYSNTQKHSGMDCKD